MSSLGNELFEWRKQMTTSLASQGRNASQIKQIIEQSEVLVFGNCEVAAQVTCPFKHIKELAKVLQEFSKRTGAFIDIEELDSIKKSP